MWRILAFHRLIERFACKISKEIQNLGHFTSLKHFTSSSRQRNIDLQLSLSRQVARKKREAEEKATENKRYKRTSHSHPSSNCVIRHLATVYKYLPSLPSQLHQSATIARRKIDHLFSLNIVDGFYF
jgi:hypothetical protein